MNLNWKTIAIAGACAVMATAASAATAPLPDIRINETAVYPESLSSGPDGTIYIGSMKGIVFRAAPGASVAEPWIRPTPENGILTILGVLADAAHGTLWLCSAPNGFGTGPSGGTTSVMAFDLKTGLTPLK